MQDMAPDADVSAVSTIAIVPTILDVVCRSTGMGFAAIARVTDERWVACGVRDEIDVGLQPGGELDVETTICSKVRDSRNAVIIEDVATDPRFCEDRDLAHHAFRSYFSAPIVLQTGEFFGTLCAFDRRPRPLNNPATIGMFTLFAELVGFHLSAHYAVSASETELSEERSQSQSERLEARRQDALLLLGDNLRDHATVEEMIAAASRIVGETLGASRAGFGYLDQPTEHIDIVADWTRPGIPSIAGRHRFRDYGELLPDILRGKPLVIDDVRSDPRTAADPKPMQRLSIGSLVNVPVMERGRVVALLIVHNEGPRVWSKEVVAFLRNVADRIEVGVGRLRAEAHQRVLNNELSHRMKNILTMVQSIVSQTMRSAGSMADAQRILTGRLVALSKAHDILLDGGSTGARLSTVIHDAVQLHLDAPDRVSTTGPTVEIGQKAALPMVLVLHELATNASKYGALSNAEGRIDIEWRLEGEAGELFLLTWTERGGPPVTPPQRKGFGTRLIERALADQLGAEVRLDYRPSGVRCSIETLLARIQEAL